MNWETPSYSFGNPNAQPPTPTQTPTSTLFPSPTLQTPRGNNHTFEHHSGWTPKFAEEYSVFNATPGRLVNTQGVYPDIATPRPSTSSSNRRPHSSTEDLRAESIVYANNTSVHSLPLPPVAPSQQLASSPGASVHGTQSFEPQTETTPQSSRGRLQEAFRGQIATPPHSVSKEPRKLAPRVDIGNMQRDQDSFFNTSGTPIHSNFLSLTPITNDMFSYPMSAPATAPAFTNVKPFWVPESSMAGMDMGFTGGDTSMFGSTPNHRAMNSFDWSRSNQCFQENVNVQSFDGLQSPTLRRQRPLMSKPPVSSSAQMMTDPAYAYHMSPMGEDPFSIVSTSGSVNPGLLYSLPEIPPSSTLTHQGSVSAHLQPRPASTQLIREPYQHQQRESQRDLEELRRSRSTRESDIASRYDRAAFSSPAKSSRPGLRRSVSDSRPPRRLPGQRPSQPLNLVQQQAIGDSSTIPTKGRSSPLKQMGRSGLPTIPESFSGNTRASVSFSIDANGRARTETKIVNNSPVAGKPSISHRQEDDWESLHSDSSTDEEPMLIPSRNTSFAMPKPVDGPLARPGKSRKRTDSRNNHNKKHKTFAVDEESEAETVVVDDDGSGDAANALRRVMESRKRSITKVSGGRSQYHARDASQGSYTRTTPNSRYQYNQSSSTNISPTTVTDPDLDTPSTDRGSSFSDSTRCICNSRNGDGFMIQCESCEKWLHGNCVGINERHLPQVYICAFCAQTPNMRGGRIRETGRNMINIGSSPLAHKSFASWR